MITDLFFMVSFVATAVWEVLPFFLISIGLSVVVRSLRLEGAIRRAFDNHIGIAILAATLVGAFSPFCSCTVIPIVSSLLLSGVPLAPIMAFWVASPTMDPEIFALSVGILGWDLALVRLGATLLLSLAAGGLTWALMQTRWLQAALPVPVVTLIGQPRTISEPVMATAESCCTPVSALPTIPVGVVAATAPATATIPLDIPVCVSGDCHQSIDNEPTTWQEKLRSGLSAVSLGSFVRKMAIDGWLLGRWLLLAFVLEAVITLYVPQDLIAGLLGGGNRLAVPLAALIGIPLYLNNLGALPIVDGLLVQGMQPGAAIAFLIAGPITTIPAMTAVYGIVSRRIFALYLGVGLVGAIVLGGLANLILL